MSPDDLNALLSRLTTGNIIPEDIPVIQQAVATGRIVLATGNRSVAVGGDVKGSVINTGDNTVILLPLEVIELVRRIQYQIQIISEGLDASVRAFLSEYIGTPQREVPFGGRQIELQALDAWLYDPGAPAYLLIAANAGRGKSALLSHWYIQVKERQEITTIFVPVSLRFNTARAEVAWNLLSRQLGSFHEEPVLVEKMSANQLRAVCQGLLNHPLPEGKRLLVVLDGIDEGIGLEIKPDFFPPTPPAGMKIVVSARFLAGDTNAEDWLRRLGWDKPDHAHSFSLDGLDRGELQDVVMQMGYPLDRFANQSDMITELYRLSEQGDPLLVRLYVESLLEHTEQLPLMSPEDLSKLEPGLKGYFQKWWDNQRELWGNQTPLKEKSVQVLLNLLACALGPLTTEDILELAPADTGLDYWTFEEALQPLRRLIVGEGGKGYIFSHPRLGGYFYERLPSKAQREWETRFLSYGERTLEALNQGSLKPEAVPIYLLHFYSSHLERAQADSEAFYTLVSRGWMQSWHWQEGIYAGFLNDVEKAWHKADEQFSDLQQPEDKRAQAVVMQVKCALCQSSIAALSGNISPEILAQALQVGLLSQAQALVIARQNPVEHVRAKALSMIAPFLEAENIQIALNEVHLMKEDFNIVEALGGLAPYLGMEQLSIALGLANEIEYERYRVEAFQKLSPYISSGLSAEVANRTVKTQEEAGLPGVSQATQKDRSSAEKQASMDEALDAVWDIDDGDGRAQALRGLAPDLSEKQLDTAIGIAQWIENPQYRIDALIELIPYLSDAQIHRVLSEAEKYMYDSTRAQLLGGLAPRLSEKDVGKALVIAKSIPDVHQQVEALCSLAPYLPEDRLQEALEFAQGIRKDQARARALSCLSPRLQAAQQKSFLSDALTATQSIGDRATVARALTRLAAYQINAEQLEVALASTEAIDYEPLRAETLSNLAPYLSGDQLERLLSMVLEFEEEYDILDALDNLVLILTPELVDRAFASVLTMKGRYERALAMCSLAPRLSDDQLKVAMGTVLRQNRLEEQIATLKRLIPTLSEKLVGELFIKTQKINVDNLWVEVLGELAPRLSPKQLMQALGIARSVEDQYNQVIALLYLIPFLDQDLHQGVIGEALALIREITDEYIRAKTLTSLAQFQTGEQADFLEEALSACLAVPDEPSRVETLTELAPYLSVEQLGKALKAAQAISFEGRCSKLLAGLAPYLSEKQLDRALAIVKKMVREDFLAEALTGLAPYLSTKQSGEALAAAQRIRFEGYRMNALVGLVPFLAVDLIEVIWEAAYKVEIQSYRAKLMIALLARQPNAEQLTSLDETLEVIRGVYSERERFHLLWELSSFVSGKQQQAVLAGSLAAVRQIPDDYPREKTFHEIVQRFAEHAEADRSFAGSLWTETISDLASRHRPGFLADLSALFPFLFALIPETQHPAVASGIFEVIRQVSEWWT